MRLRVFELGVVSYREALALQRSLAVCLVDGTLHEDMLLLLEHPPVVTLGRSSKEANVLLSHEALAARGIELHEVERGGDVTFHGPGQLVGYPIMDLRRHRQDLHWYLRQLEAALVASLGTLGVDAGTSSGQTGVWTGGRKIASIGVHARQWVTWHGFALNVTTDLSFFDVIVACGIEGVQMTSIASELARAGLEPPQPGDLQRRSMTAVTAAFADTFAMDPVVGDALDLPRVPAIPGR